ncbi:MutS-related protein [Polaribacter cellanae]|uniref:DNA mismatch repair protein MutS n=1 Tax=Polaribacter cellanae TaxID=2818493 RepID=A0A975CPX3_9FLAO|nr:DNA mismatch repair protein MutS [Polaribacter cellanae]QTE23573.1 DNA mismatch repair protein MutS [Polaribacter cellanae]
MNYFLALLFIFTSLYIFKRFSNRRKLKKIRASLSENWGKEYKKSHYNFFVIGKYFNNNFNKSEAYHIISEKCKIDLDIDDIFKFIDRTSSKIGEQYLYFKLRTIGSIENLLKFDSLVDFFKLNKKVSISFQMELSKLNSNNSYYLEELINDKQLEKPKYMWLIITLTISAISCLILAFFNPFFGLALVPISAINMVFHYKNKHSVTYYLNGVNQLSRALNVSKELSKHPYIKTYFKDLSFIQKIKSIKFKTEFIAFEKNVSNEFLFAFWFLFEIIKILFNIEYLVFYSFIDSITKERKSIEKMFLFIGEIDIAISTASLKSGNLKICKPTFTKDKTIDFTDIYHPLIENCIENNILLNNKSMLLTGSNMSGKTTFIRTVAVNSILAQTLHICFAKKYVAPYYKVFSSIRITDNLLDDTSYYLQEVLAVKELINASLNLEPCLFVLDEIFKGTNTVERISGGKAILSFLNKKQHTVLVSTHDIELTELLEKDNFALFHFSEKIKDDKLLFDHKLKAGKLKTRNAIKILDLYKYPPEIIKEAKDVESTYFS